ncbi:MAG: NADH-quinone oxidoreductase subunit N [Planctomycetota bacterium]
MNTREYWVDSVQAVAPEVALVAAAFVALFAHLLCGKRRPQAAAWVSLAGFASAAALLIARWGHEPMHVVALVEVDGFSTFFRLLMSAGCALVVLTWMHSGRERRPLEPQIAFLLLCACLGGFLMVGTNHALLLVLGLELVSLSSCAVVACDKHRPASTEAAMKLFVFSGFATALTIYGLSLLYGLTGTLDFARMGAASVDAQGLAQELASNPLPVGLALLLVSAGLACKISLAPLHLCAPDVAAGSASPVAAFLAVVVRIAGFGALMRFLSALFVQDHASRLLQHYAGKFGSLLAILAAATMTIGSLAAMRQPGLKRLLAWTAIAQAGFVTIGIACLNETGFSASLVVLASLALMSAGAFAVLMRFESLAGSDRLEDLRGLGWKHPLLGVAAILLFASLAGLPPTLGFYDRYRVCMEAWNLGMGWLVLVALVNTWFGAHACLRLVSVLFGKPHGERSAMPSRVLMTLAVGLALATLALGLWPWPIEQWAGSALDLLRE